MSGRIPQQFIDELIARTDIVALIDKRVPLTRRGREYVACCPFHHEKTPSFTVSPEKQFYHCFGCGAHGSALGFLMAYERLEFLEAVDQLAADLGLEVPHEAGTARPVQAMGHQPLYDVLNAAAEFYRKQLRAHPAAIDYLKRRGVSGAIARDFGIGYAPPGWDTLLTELGATFPQSTLQAAGLLSRNDSGRVYDKFRDRIMFPIRDARGRTVAFGGRVLQQGEPKYLNSPETAVFHKSNTLYGLYELRRQRQRFDGVIVVEGYMDVIALAQYEIRNAVATLGTATTAEHLRALFRQADKVVFCFDGDRAGREAAWRALHQALAALQDGLEAAFLFLPEGEDPDTYLRKEGREAFMARLQEAIPLSEYLLATLKERFPAPTLEQRTKLALAAKKLMQDMPAGMLRNELERRVAALRGLPLPNRAAPPQVATPTRRRHIRMTPIRLAVAALLHEPALAQEVPTTDPPRYAELKEGELLTAVANLARELERPTTAALVERFRNTDWGTLIDYLSVWEPPSAEDAPWSRQLRDALAQVQRQVMEHRIDDLLQLARSGPLSPEQKLELSRLLSEQRLYSGKEPSA